MKKLILFLSFLSLMINSEAQVYQTIPFSEDFNSFTDPGDWTGATAWRRDNTNQRVRVTTDGAGLGPVANDPKLMLDDNETGSADLTRSATLHLDLSGATEYTMTFYMKDYGEEEDAADGIFFLDTASGTYLKAWDIDGPNTVDYEWIKYTLDIDRLADSLNIVLTDSFEIRFQERDNETYNNTGATDGLAFDSIHVFEAGPFTAGKIGYSDTLCGGSGNVTISNVTSPTEGDGGYVYSWQESVDGVNWAARASAPIDSLVMGTVTSSIWIRRGVTSTSTLLPIYSDPVLIFVPATSMAIVFGLNAKYCSNEDSVLLGVFPPSGVLTDITPTGNQTSLNGNYFRPGGTLNDSTGELNRLSLLYTDPYGCVYVDTVTTTVHTAPIVSFASVGSYPNTQSTAIILDPLISSTITGIVNSVTGSGVAKNGSNQWIFTPSASGGVGTKTLTTTFTSSFANGSCVTEATSDAQITGTLTGTIFPVSTYCELDDPVTHTRSTAPAPAFTYPWKYCSNATSSLVYHYISGTGITSSVSASGGVTATFDPEVAGPGTHTIYYVYRYEWRYVKKRYYDWPHYNWFCPGANVWPYEGPSYIVPTTYTSYTTTKVISQTIIVNPKPNITVELSKYDFCEYEAPSPIVSKLDGAVVGADQLYLDGAVTGTTFDPSLVSIGSHQIVVKHGVLFCDNYDTVTVNVHAAPVIAFGGINNQYCKNDSESPITYNPSGFGGIFSGDTLGLNTTLNTFDPSLYSTGSQTITYSYTDGNMCTSDSSLTTLIDVVPDLSIGGLNSELLYCEDTVTVDLIGENNGSAFAGGEFFGASVIDGGSNGTGTFHPSALIPDSLYQIGYTYTNAQTCTDSITVGLVVASLPEVSFSGLDPQYCASDAQVTLTGNHPTGVFTGTGILGFNIFDPSLITGSDNVKFEYTDGNGCTNDTVKIVQVDSLPSVFFTGMIDTVCADEPTYNLIGNQPGGYFSRVDNSDIYNDTVQFVADEYDLTSNIITDYITFSYTDINTCFNSDTHYYTVNPLPVPKFTLPPNLSYCEDNASTLLFGGLSFSHPWSEDTSYFYGNGVVNTSYDPTIVNIPVGLTQVTDSAYYVYVDVKGCRDTVLNTTVVHALPYVSFNFPQPEYCESDGAVTLNPFPAIGGAFTGSSSPTGILGNSFDPSVAGPGTHFVTFTYIDPFNCKNDTTLSVIVNDLPVVSFTGLTTPVCADEPSMKLEGNQVGGQFLRVSNIPIIQDTVDFIPTDYDITSFVVNDYFIYEFIDANGCFNADTQNYRVNPLPVPEFTGLNPVLPDGYCTDGNNTTLVGGLDLPHPYVADSTYFYGTGVQGTNYNPTIVPIPDAVSQLDTVYFVYIDSEGCRDTVSQQTIVHELPVVSFAFQDGSNFYGTEVADSTFCETQTSVNIEQTIFGTGNSDVFEILDANIIITGTSINPSILGFTGLDTMVYKHEDRFGCVNYDTHQFTVYPVPAPDFILGSFCNDDSIQFYDSTKIIAFLGLGNNNDSVVDWLWDFNDAGNTSTLQHPKYRYVVPTTYTIGLTSTSAQGCINKFSEANLVGEPPKAAFEWDNVCFGERIKFTDYSTATVVDPIDKWVWDFDDGYVLDNSTNGNLGSDLVPSTFNGGITADTFSGPSHIYSTQQTYYVSLILETGSGCIDTLKRYLNVRPVINITQQDPYAQNFDSLNTGWFPGGSTNGVEDVYSWAWGDAAGSVINDNGNGNKSWVTNLLSDHNNLEQSYLDGPCFNFDSVVRPMIKMNYWADMQQGNDGASLQWSDDNGSSWNTVGEIGDGIEWYNESSIGGNPGNQPLNQYGISYQDTSKSWIEGRHDLDALIGKRLIRMRIAFGSDQFSSNEGVGFDDVWIGERSRITLLEYFTNSSESGSVQDDADIDDLVTRNLKDVIDIQYHTEFPGNDDMNNHNPADPSARALYYGAFNVGRAVLNGNAYNGVSSNVTDNDIKLQMLKDSPFSLTVGKEIVGGDIKATAYLEAREDIDSSDVTLHIAIIERQISELTGNNGDILFESVLKKMLPAASGTVYTKDWTMNEVKGLTETWTMQNVFDVDELEIIAFVQDNVTKEVYQVSTTDVLAVPPVVVPPLEVEELVNQEVKFRMFPNPTDKQLTILFNQFVDSPNIVFFDQLGRVMDDYNTNKMTESVTFSLDYPAGIYYVKTNVGDKVLTQKLIITK